MSIKTGTIQVLERSNGEKCIRQMGWFRWSYLAVYSLPRASWWYSAESFVWTTNPNRIAEALNYLTDPPTKSKFTVIKEIVRG